MTFSTLRLQGARALPTEALAACAGFVACAAQRSSAAANQAAAATASLKVLQLGGSPEAAAMPVDNVAPIQLQWQAAVAAALVSSVQVQPGPNLAVDQATPAAMASSVAIRNVKSADAKCGPILVQPAVWAASEAWGGASPAGLCRALLRVYTLERSTAARSLAVAAASIVNKLPASEHGIS